MSLDTHVEEFCKEIKEALTEALPQVEILLKRVEEPFGPLFRFTIRQDGEKQDFFQITTVIFAGNEEEPEPLCEDEHIIFDPRLWDMRDGVGPTTVHTATELRGVVDRFFDEPGTKTFLRSWIH